MAPTARRVKDDGASCIPVTRDIPTPQITVNHHRLRLRLELVQQQRDRAASQPSQKMVSYSHSPPLHPLPLLPQPRITYPPYHIPQTPFHVKLPPAIRPSIVLLRHATERRYSETEPARVPQLFPSIMQWNPMHLSQLQTELALVLRATQVEVFGNHRSAAVLLEESKGARYEAVWRCSRQGDQRCILSSEFWEGRGCLGEVRGCAVGVYPG